MASANLVLTGSESVLATSGEEIVDLLRGGQGVLNILPLAGVKEELDAAIHNFEDAKPGASESVAPAQPRRAASGS